MTHTYMCFFVSSRCLFKNRHFDYAKFLQQRCNTRGFIYVNAYARTSMQRVQKVAAPVGVAAVTVCSLSSTPLSIRFRIDAW